MQSRFPELAEIVNKRLDGDNSAPKQTPSEGSYTVKVTAKVLNVRSGAGTNYPAKTTIKKGEVYTIVETNGDWGKLKSGAGWIHLGYTTKTNAKTPTTSSYKKGRYKVTARIGLNVRSSPRIPNPLFEKNNIVKVYKWGALFDTFEINGEWARTPSGWVCLKYATLVYAYN